MEKVRGFGIDLKTGRTVELKGESLPEILGNLGNIIEGARDTNKEEFGGKSFEEFINSDDAEAVVNPQLLEWMRFTTGIMKSKKEVTQAAFALADEDKKLLEARALEVKEVIEKAKKDLNNMVRELAEKWEPKVSEVQSKGFSELCYRAVDKSLELDRITPELADKFRRSIGFLDERHIDCRVRLEHYEDMIERILSAESKVFSPLLESFAKMKGDEPDYETAKMFVEKYNAMGTEKDPFFKNGEEDDEDDDKE